MHGNLGKGDESRHGAEVARPYGVCTPYKGFNIV